MSPRSRAQFAFFFLLLSLFWEVAARADHMRMSVTFRFRGELMTATFFSNVRDNEPADFIGAEFHRAMDRLEALRYQHYTGRMPEPKTEEERKKIEAEKRDFQAGFFDWEEIRRHDETLIIHRGVPQYDSAMSPNYPLGIGPDVVGLIAMDRLGHVFYDANPGFEMGDQFEHFLMEKRLIDLGIRVPRQAPYFWVEPDLPPGVFKHWQPQIADEYFKPGNIIYGDTIQVTALFAEDGLFPLLHSIASVFGVFSTGRLLPPGVQIKINGIVFEGPKVFIPTLMVSEMFNKVKDGKFKQGLRTRYFSRSGATPLIVNGKDGWMDPRVNFGAHVQIFQKPGNLFREGWTEFFAREQDFQMVRDVVFEQAWYEEFNGERLERAILPELGSRYPQKLDACLAGMLQPNRREIITRMEKHPLFLGNRPLMRGGSQVYHSVPVARFNTP